MSIINIKNILMNELSGSYVPDFLLYETVDSTNDLLKDIVSQKEVSLPDGTVFSGHVDEGFSVISLCQKKGKGRSGRTFFSPPDCSIYLSVLLKPDMSFEESLLITPMAAVAVHDAINKVCGVEAGIKWVNDLYINDRKICGILTEASIVPGKSMLEYAIVGIGVNIFWPKCNIPMEIKDVYGTIFPYETDYNDEIVAKLGAEIINNTIKYYKEISDRTFVSVYRNSMLMKGEKVTYMSGDREINVTVNDIDDDVHLLVTDEGGNKLILRDGEVRLKMLRK